MKIRRFVGPNTRDAMRQLKTELGDDALILANRKTEHGVEILATVDPKFDQLTRKAVTPAMASMKIPEAAAAPEFSRVQTGSETTPPAMSTVLFQDYVRERLTQAQQAVSPPLLRQVSQPAPAPLAPPQAQPTRALPSISELNEQQSVWRGRPRAGLNSDPQTGLNQMTPRGETLDPNPNEYEINRAKDSVKESSQLLAELREVKTMLRRQVDSATWLGGGSAHSARARRSHQLLDAGLSPGLIRYLVEHMPPDLEPGQEQAWLEQALEKNCRKSKLVPALLDEGGVCALIGPTGVGKTTTIAKLATRAVLRQGADAVALVTLDNFRVGAFEQLEAYGRLLGIAVHSAKDQSSLEALLTRMRYKKTILIDTVGVSTQDDKLAELLGALDLPIVQKVFVTSASTQGDTIDRAIRAYQVTKANPVILTKLDEVERLGPAIDCVVRHGLLIAGLTDGQKVPEDWRSADPLYLARQALRYPDSDPWQYEETIAMSRLEAAQSHEKWAYV